MSGRPGPDIRDNQSFPCPNDAECLDRKGDQYKFVSYWFDSTKVQTHGFESHNLPKQETELVVGVLRPDNI